MMYQGGSTALQRTLSQYQQKKRDAKIESTSPSALSGIGKWNKMGEDNLQKGLTDMMSGNMQVQNSANLGTSFSPSQSNPWEAFMATPAEELEQDHKDGSQQGYWMSAYQPQARGINMTIW